MATIVKKSHRDRKNPSAHEAWKRRKAERNKTKVVVHQPRPWPLNGQEGYEA